MNSNGSGGRLEGLFAGRGFYIVLFLCAAVIGVSSWMIAGNKTMENKASKNEVSFDSKRVETVIITPAPSAQTRPAMAQAETAPAEAQESAQPVMSYEAIPSVDEGYIWPVLGQVDRYHDQENLAYDVTMQDWRTHDGLDIAAPLGEEVVASRAGIVDSIDEDAFYGVVITLDHGDGSYSIYASLSPETAVSVGEWVDSGATLGYIGGTARCETAQAAHLHYKILINGVSVDPLIMLP